MFCQSFSKWFCLIPVLTILKAENCFTCFCSVCIELWAAMLIVT